MPRERVVKKEYSDGNVEYYPNLRVDTDTGMYWWYEMIDGTHYRKSTGEKSIKKAYSKIKIMRRDSTFAPKDRFKMCDLFEHATKIQEGKSERTHAIAVQGCKRLTEYFDDSSNKCKYVDQFEKNPERHWLDYVKFAKERNLRKLGRVGDFTHDRKFFVFSLNRAYRNNWIKKKYDSSYFPIPNYESNHGIALTDEQVNKLLECALNELDNTRLYVMIHIAVSVGMRKEEVIGLSLDEIDFRRKIFKLDYKRIKTRSSRKLDPFIPEDILPLIKKLYNESKKKKGKYLFPLTLQNKELDYKNHLKDFRKSWARLVEITGVECTFKDLRSTCITNMIKERIPPTTIAAYCGNSVEEIMRVYDKVHRDLREEVKVLFNGRFYSEAE